MDAFELVSAGGWWRSGPRAPSATTRSTGWRRSWTGRSSARTAPL